MREMLLETRNGAAGYRYCLRSDYVYNQSDKI